MPLSRIYIFADTFMAWKWGQQITIFATFMYVYRFYKLLSVSLNSKLYCATYSDLTNVLQILVNYDI